MIHITAGMNGLKDRLSSTAFVFRGYNVTNLGRSAELLAHPSYGPIVEPYLKEASEVSAPKRSGRRSIWPPEFVASEETDLDSYAEAVALIVAMEMAQLRCSRSSSASTIQPGSPWALAIAWAKSRRSWPAA